MREAFAARRRRESELSALFDTANDLAALRGVDSVLTAIVRRARQLLGTDVSYLTLNDPPRGDTYMRVTDGSVSARFQALRLPMGAGLGGLVAQTAAPYATASYFSDARFKHTHEINDGVRDEGLVAILGVPLIRGSQVIGVLFAADRTERTFDRHGGVAARLAGRARRDRPRQRPAARGDAGALDELSAASRELRAHTASVERAAGGPRPVHRRRPARRRRGRRRRRGHRDARRDDHGPRRGGPGDTPGAGERGRGRRPDSALPPDPAAALTLARSTGRTVRDGDWWTAAVTVGSELLGGLVLHRERRADRGRPAHPRARRPRHRPAPADPPDGERGGEPRARRAAGGAAHAPRSAIPTGCANGPAGSAPTSTRRRRWSSRGSRSAPGPRAVAAATHLAATRGGLAGAHDGCVVLCLPDIEPGPAAALVRRELTAAGADR